MAKKEFKPTTVTLKNTNPVVTPVDGVVDQELGNVAFRYFRVNFVETLKPADEVVIVTTTAEETAYYMALNDDKIGLEVTAE